MSDARAPVTRSKNLLAPPLRMEPAFDDPKGIAALIDRASPYKTLSAVHKNVGETSGGWFRNFWALGEKVVLEGAEPFFYNQKFIEAAQQSFQADVIRPVAMMTNLNLPAPGAPFHLDLPFFRGVQNREVPSWMLAPMGYSGLFHNWAIPVASAITWFYEGVGGEFEYWPNGLKQPSMTESPPYSNRCVLADNEYMYHRVGAIGHVTEQNNYDNIGYDALLSLSEDRKWRVEEDEKVIAEFDYGQVRISILWKAYCFKDEAEAGSYDDHTHDLTPELVADIFCADMKSRGLPFKVPGDFATDKVWKDNILAVYRAPDGGASY
ncbi:MAG: hypothetical protein JKY04_00870 [Sneathiella sp.]|nr:hypothetical protein [Sneathiella sp.]